MRNRKERKSAPVSVLPILAATAAVIAMFPALRAGTQMLGKAGERAAIFSAAINMPDSGLNLLRERFQGELTGDEEQGESQPELHSPPPSLVPEQEEREHGIAGQPDAPEETEQGSERDYTPPKAPPKIPEKYAAPVISENFAGQDNGGSIRYGNGFIKNDTAHSEEDVLAILEDPWPVKFDDPGEPQVLIVHTHATESYEKYDRDIYDTRNTWRSTDNSNNMVAVGDAMREVLEENGISVLHDTTQHDYPSYNGSYERAAETIQNYLDEYPGIKIVLDLHRDAMQRDGAIVKPVAVIDGKKAAQIMIISACDDGTMDVPEWRDNLRFAATFQDYMEQYYPELTKPVYFCYRKYNMDLTTGSLLLEFGSNANTLDEAVYSARMAGQALSNLILDKSLN